MNSNDEKVKKALENEEIPKELEPENIKKMLDEKAPSKKRKKISVAGRLVALSAACAVIVGSTAIYINKDNIFDKSKCTGVSVIPETSQNSIAPATETDIKLLEKTGSYMTGAEDYEQIYTMFKEASEKSHNDRGVLTAGAKSAELMETAVAEDADGAVNDEESYVEYDEAAPAEVNGAAVQSADNEMTVEPVEEPIEYAADEESSSYIPEEPVEEPIEEPDGEEFSESSAEESSEVEESSEAEESIENNEEESDDEEYSDTYNQEENVLEADIVKTNGKNIYYVCNDYDKKSVSSVNYASVDKGTFTGSGKIELNDVVSGCFGEEYETDVYVQDMYLYNDMLAVLGTVNGYNESGTDEDYWYDWKDSCFVAFYTTDGTPQLIDVYYQDGSYHDVRISPDGYMYLITDYSTVDFSYIEEPSQIERYIPSCGVSESVECLPAEDILLPEENPENMYNTGYSVIGSLDLTQSGTFAQVDSKALAGYTGDIYCSGSNLYTTFGWDDTEITRIAIGGGIISPEASGTVEGRVNDQFSMSEYNGYFRIAVTNDEYEEVYHSYYDDEETAWDRVKDKITGEESGYYSNELVKRDNRLYVLDMDLNVVGSVSDFGIDEEIKSVKFSGDTAYVVTYEQTDPLFAIDLSDPTNPTILDEFKILGYSTYMQEWGDGLLLGFGVNADEDGIETGIKLTMFDNSDPYNLNALATYTLDGTDDEWLYSEAVWDRKALLIAPEKNLIGVPVIIENYVNYEYETEWNNTAKYMFFSYDNNEFILKGEISSTENSAWVDGFGRAVYIGDYVYALSADKFISADIETITECDRVDF